jgi:hypothetical protein
MSNKQITLNGVVYYPTRINQTIAKRAKDFDLMDGSKRLAVKSVKRRWEIEWNLVQESTVAALNTLANLTAAFPVIDAFGVGYSGIILSENYTMTHDATNIASNGIEYFIVSLTVDEV